MNTLLTRLQDLSIRNIWDSRRKFILKASLLFVLAAAICIPFMMRFQIGYSAQLVSCLPGTNVFLVDKQDTEMVRGNIYLFRSKGMAPVFEDGTPILKYLRGLPGDKVTVNADGVFVNGEKFAEDFMSAKWLGIDPSRFYGERTLREGEYWFITPGKMSFDSRYWGAVHPEQIIGRGYVLF